MLTMINLLIIKYGAFRMALESIKEGFFSEKTGEIKEAVDPPSCHS